MYVVSNVRNRRSFLLFNTSLKVRSESQRGSDLISSGYGSFDLTIKRSFHGVDSVSRHGNRSSTAFDLDFSAP